MLKTGQADHCGRTLPFLKVSYFDDLGVRLRLRLFLRCTKSDFYLFIYLSTVTLRLLLLAASEVDHEHVLLFINSIQTRFKQMLHDLKETL